LSSTPSPPEQSGTLVRVLGREPFARVDDGLAAYGYTEQEYFIEGTATRFEPVGDLTFDGRWTAEPAGEAPYRTRILVVIPTDPARFNGTVLVDWINVSAGFEILALEDESIWEQGFAYVGVSAQHVGIHGHPDHRMGSTR
jgi:Alpha/beta hydrolase domain